MKLNYYNKKKLKIFMASVYLTATGLMLALILIGANIIFPFIIVAIITIAIFLFMDIWIVI